MAFDYICLNDSQTVINAHTLDHSQHTTPDDDGINGVLNILLYKDGATIGPVLRARCSSSQMRRSPARFVSVEMSQGVPLQGDQ